jgi:flavin reductase
MSARVQPSRGPGGLGHPLSGAFVAAMGAMATGVTVVATDGAGGRFAQTVSAMCSVSADPPMILICLHGRSPANEAIVTNGVFCVNVLATQHDHVADTFAGRPWPGKEPWDFTCGDWDVAGSGSPRIQDAIASFDCTVHDVVAAGTHKIYIGEVNKIASTDGTPLLYAEQRYQRPETHEPSVFEEFPDARPSYLRKEKAE